jgi:hypothetical protein
MGKNKDIPEGLLTGQRGHISLENREVGKEDGEV